MIQPVNIIENKNNIIENKNNIIENKNNIKLIIDKLPVDIVNMIYIDYIKPELVCAELNDVLISVESQNLNCTPLYNFLINNNILQNKIIVKYLLKNNTIFNNIYQSHIIKGTQTYEKFPNITSSLAQCWIMCLYH